MNSECAMILQKFDVEAEAELLKSKQERKKRNKRTS